MAFQALDEAVAGRSLNSGGWKTLGSALPSLPLLVLWNQRAGRASGLSRLFQPSSLRHSFPGHCPWPRKDQLIHSSIGPNIY